MSLTKRVFILSMIAVFNFNSPQAEAFANRATVKTELTNNCARSPSSCASFVAEELALAAQLGNSPEGMALALGLADAVVAISKANPALGLLLATLVAKKGPAFLQAAVAAAVSAASSNTASGAVSAGSAG
jgi:hypothetical protein